MGDLAANPAINVAAVLKDKKTLLSAQGTFLTDCYYSAANSTVSLVEMTYNYGRSNFSLNNLVPNGQSQIQIPNNSFLSEVYLYLRINALPANSSLPRGWGLAAIQSISFLMGSTNVPNLTITGQSHYQWLMNQIETKEKRSEILRLCGEARVNNTGSPLNEIQEAYIPLVLPFAKYGGIHAKLPLDTTMYSSPILVQLAFNPATFFIAGAGALSFQRFDQGSIFLKQGDLSNKEMSIGRLLKADPSRRYTYPFIHAISYQTTAGMQGINSSAPATIPLQSFINADFVGMTLGVLKLTNLQGDGTQSINPFHYELLRDVSIIYNGLPMLVSPGRMWQLYNLSGQYGSQAVENAVMTGNTTPPTNFAFAPSNDYVLEEDFTRLRSLQFENHFDNTWRVGQQTLQFQFTVPDSTPNNYILLATYYYNGVIENEGGESRIYFD